MSEASDNALKWAFQAEKRVGEALSTDHESLVELDKAQGMASMWAFVALAEVFGSETFQHKLNR